MPRVTMWGWQSLLGADSVCLPNHPIICLEHPPPEQSSGLTPRPNQTSSPWAGWWRRNETQMTAGKESGQCFPRVSNSLDISGRCFIHRTSCQPHSDQ